MIVLFYFIGCIAAYFFARAVLGGTRTIGNVIASIIICVLSWLGLVFFGVTWLVWKILRIDKEF